MGLLARVFGAEVEDVVGLDDGAAPLQERIGRRADLGEQFGRRCARRGDEAVLEIATPSVLAQPEGSLAQSSGQTSQFSYSKQWQWNF